MMVRSKWKGVFIDSFLFEEFFTQKKKRIKVWSRESTIIPQFVGHKFEVYNGKGFYNFQVTDEMVGHKFGEFALTRKRAKHKKK